MENTGKDNVDSERGFAKSAGELSTLSTFMHEKNVDNWFIRMNFYTDEYVQNVIRIKKMRGNQHSAC